MIHSLVGRTRWLIRGRSTTAAVLQTTVLQVATILANLATGILTARLLAPVGRGEVAAINLIPLLLGSALTLGIPGALLYNLKHEAEHSAQFMGAAIVSVTALGVLGVLGGYIAAPYALHQYSGHVVQLTRFFLLTVPVALYMYISATAFESMGDFWYANGTRFLTPVLTLVSLCGFALAGRLDAMTAAASYALPGVLIGLKMLADVVRTYRPTFFRIPRHIYQKLFSYGLRCFGIDLLRTVGQQVDQVLVVAFLTPSAMGLYAVALAVSRVLQLFQSSVVRVLLPRIAARPVGEVVELVGRAMRVTLLLTAALGVGIIVLAPFLLHLVYGNKFIEATGVLRVLAVEAVFAGATWILAQAFLALGKPGIVTSLQGVGLGLSFPLMVVLIPRFGLLGAGISLLLSTLARFGLVLICFPWLLRCAVPSLVINPGDIASVLARFGRGRVDADG